MSNHEYREFSSQDKRGNIEKRRSATYATAKTIPRFLNRQLLFDALNESPLGIAVESLEGKVLFANTTLCEMLEFDEDEIRNKHRLDFSHPDECQADDQFFQQLSGGTIGNYELERRYRRKSGSMFWGRLCATLMNDRPMPVVFARIQDITERKRAQDAVRESEQRFRMVTDTAPVLIWMSGTDKLCTYFNKPWLEFTGRTITQEYGDGWTNGVHSDDFQRYWRIYSEHFDNRQQFTMEYRLRRYDGQFRWVISTGVPRFNQNGAFAGFIGSAIDITNSKEDVDKLREYERVVENSDDIIVVIDRQFRYLIANRHLLLKQKLRQEEIIGHHVSELFEDEVYEEIIKPKLNKAFQGEVVTYELTHTYPDLGLRNLLVSYFPIKSSAGIERVACIGRDITERKTISRKLIEIQEQERSRIGRELHDHINQRLALVAIELDQLRAAPPTSTKEVALLLTQLWKKIGEVSSEVHSISHNLHNSQLENLGLAVALRSLCREVEATKQISITFLESGVAASIPSDVSLCLYRILQEALNNAVKHSNATALTVRVAGCNNHVQLTIEDNGAGFNVEEALKKGGLGLTNMRERVQLLSGKIEIQGNPMIGTTIDVKVPLKTPEVLQREL